MDNKYQFEQPSGVSQVTISNIDKMVSLVKTLVSELYTVTVYPIMYDGVSTLGYSVKEYIVAYWKDYQR